MGALPRTRFRSRQVLLTFPIELSIEIQLLGILVFSKTCAYYTYIIQGGTQCFNCILYSSILLSSSGKDFKICL